MSWRSRILVAVLPCAALLWAAQPASGQDIDEGFRTDIQKLLDVSGSSRLSKNMAGMLSTQLLESMKVLQPAIPDRALQIVREVIDAQFEKALTDPDGLTVQIVSLYAKHFTHDEIRALLAFFATDVGRKLAETTPVLAQEAAEAGRRWAEMNRDGIMATLQSRFRAEGLFPIAPAQPSAAAAGGAGSAATVVRPGNGVTSPRLIRDVKPSYTEEAMRAKIQGVVTMEAVIEPDGTVGNVRIVKSLDQVYGLDDQAIRTVKQWLFAPGTRDGAAVRVLVQIEMTFTLRK